MKTQIIKVVSGGQTGADRGGLDAAIALAIPHGGWCPKGRLAEDGRIPDVYNQQELYSRFYAHRTEQNVIDSDVTVIFTYGPPEGGSKRTVQFAEKHGRPYICIDMNGDNLTAAEKIVDWLLPLQNSQLVLNVAGSRGSRNPGLQRRVCDIIKEVIMTINREGGF